MEKKTKAKLAGLGLLAALALVPAFEGKSLTPYRDTGGVWTDCYGHTGADVVPGKASTDAECEDKLGVDLIKANAAVDACVRVPLNHNQRSAFVSFAYNVGGGNFCRSTLIKRLNARDYRGACDELLRWVYVAGKDCRLKASNCAGIVRRRVSERELCLARPL